MSVISKLIERVRGSKEKFRNMEEDYHLQRRLQDKQLSANERELISYQNENRQRQIARMLEWERKRRLHEWWAGHQILKEKNIFRGQKRIFAGKDNLFRLRHG